MYDHTLYSTVNSNVCFEVGWVNLAQNFGRMDGPPPTALGFLKLDRTIFHVVLNIGGIFVHFVTKHAFDRRTDGQNCDCQDCA